MTTVINANEVTTGLAKEILAPAFSAYKTVDQVLANGVPATVTFEAEEFDTNNCFAANRFTPNVAGYYQVNATIFLFGTVPVDPLLASFYKNGVVYRRIAQIGVSGGPVGVWVFSGSMLVYMNGTTDYLEIVAMVGSTAPSVGYSKELCSFNGFLVRAA